MAEICWFIANINIFISATHYQETIRNKLETGKVSKSGCIEIMNRNLGKEISGVKWPNKPGRRSVKRVPGSNS